MVLRFPFRLCLLILIASALRLVGLTRESLWNDELTSWVQCHFDSLSSVVRLGVIPDVHPPGYEALLYGWTRLAGDSEWALRMPSAIAGILCVPAMYALAKSLCPSSSTSGREGLYAAGIVALSPTAIWYAQEARAYSLVLLFSIVTTWLGLAICRRRSIWLECGYVAAAVVLAYLHYFGLLLVACQIAVGLVIAPRRTVVMAIAIGVFYAPWVPVMLTHLGRAGHYWAPAPTAFDVFGYPLFAFGSWYLLVAAALVMATLRWDRHTQWLMAWFWVPFLVVWLLSLRSSILVYRYFIICLPAAYLLLARALAGTRHRLLVVSALLIAAGITVMRWPHKEQYREAVATVHLPSVVIADETPWLFDYYFVHTGSTQRVDVTGPDTDAIVALARVRRTDQAWFLWAHDKPSAETERRLAALGTIERHDFVGAGAWLIVLPHM